jgi:hypothetical protein
MSVILPIDAYIQLNGIEYYGKLVKDWNRRNHHPMSAVCSASGQFDVAKEPVGR